MFSHETPISIRSYEIVLKLFVQNQIYQFINQMPDHLHGIETNWMNVCQFTKCKIMPGACEG